MYINKEVRSFREWQCHEDNETGCMIEKDCGGRGRGGGWLYWIEDEKSFS